MGEGKVTYDVYVANLPLDYHESQIRKIFDVAGEIAAVKIVPPKKGEDRDGKIAFVKFINEADAQCVGQYMSNYDLPDGRKLVVRYRPEKKNNKSVVTTSSVTPASGKEKGTQKSAKKPSAQIEVYVSHVESPIQFWGQLYSIELEEKLLSLTNTMEAICPTLPKLNFDPLEGIFACQFSQDGLWYRCKVEKKISETEVYVRYIDYGNAETTAKENLINLPLYIIQLSPLCTLYRVSGFELSNKEPSSEVYREGVHALHDIIGEQMIQLEIVKRDDVDTIVNIKKVLDGPLLDVGAQLILSGAVHMKGKPDVQDDDLKINHENKLNLSIESVENSSQSVQEPTNNISNTDVANTDVDNTAVSDTDGNTTDVNNTDLANTDVVNTAVSDTDSVNTDVANTDFGNTAVYDTDVANNIDVSSTDVSSTDVAYIDVVNTEFPLEPEQNILPLATDTIENGEENSENVLNDVTCTARLLEDLKRNLDVQNKVKDVEIVKLKRKLNEQNSIKNIEIENLKKTVNEQKNKIEELETKLEEKNKILEDIIKNVTVAQDALSKVSQ